MSASETRRLLFLLGIGAAVLAAGLGLRDPWPPDEPRFALIAKDMAESGQWLIPRVGGVLYPDKPPLFFWLVAVFYELTGSVAVAFRLPGLFAGVGVLWLVYDLARRLSGERIALWTAGALLVTVQFPLQMKTGQIDPLLCFWTTLGVYGLARHLLLGPAWGWAIAGGAACGVGVITKGVGFLPFLILIPWWYARRRGWPLPRLDGGPGRGLLVPVAFLAAIGLWLVPMLLVTAGAADPDFARYRDNILFRQTVTRYADAWGHLKPAWYLLTNAVPWLWLPFTALLPWLVPAWVRDLQARRAAALLFLGWVVLVLLFFSMSAGKRSLYIFPALPALALAAGPHLPGVLARAAARRVLFVLALLIAAVPLAGGLYALARPEAISDWVTSPQDGRALGLGCLAMGLVAAGLALFLRPGRAAAGYAASVLVLLMGISFLVDPRIDVARSGAVVTDAAARALAPGESLAFVGWKEQFLLQWNRPAVHFGYRRDNDAAEAHDAAAWLSRHPDYRLVLPEDMIEPCFDAAGLRFLATAHRQRWLLADAADVTDACLERRAVTAAVHYVPGGTHAAAMPGEAIRSAR
ncbi:MAG TPA: glycosyltransferase family 39 protein [Woeseiaceae bacterium]